MSAENTDAPPTELLGTLALKRAGAFIVYGTMGLILALAFAEITRGATASAFISALSTLFFLLAIVHACISLTAYVRKREGFNSIFLAGFMVLLSLLLTFVGGVITLLAAVDFGMG